MSDPYRVAQTEARRLANEAAKANPPYAKKGGCDWGLERLGDHWHIFRLPLPANRFGFESRCEVILPDVFRF